VRAFRAGCGTEGQSEEGMAGGTVAAFVGYCPSFFNEWFDRPRGLLSEGSGRTFRV